MEAFPAGAAGELLRNTLRSDQRALLLCLVSNTRGRYSLAIACAPLPRLQITSVDGAGGAVLSSGLLQQLDAQQYKSCILGREGTRGGPTTCGGESSRGST